MKNKTKYKYQQSVILKAIDAFSQILPAQAPIRDFVHHNTLHGFEQLKFDEALTANKKLTGASAFWSQNQFQKAYQAGRISDEDINQVLDKNFDFNSHTKSIITGPSTHFDNSPVSITCKNVLRLRLLYPFKPITKPQFNWKIKEERVLEKFQFDLPNDIQETLLNTSTKSEQATVTDIWAACLQVFNIDACYQNKEKIVQDIDDARNDSFDTSRLQKQKHEINGASHQLQQDAWDKLEQLIAKVGENHTLRGLLNELTGIDINIEIIPYLLPYISNWLDEGVASMKVTQKSKTGFYQAWKQSAAFDKSGLFLEIPDWQEHIDSLPNDAMETIIAELHRMGIPVNNWEHYLIRLVLELPGWSGMFYWRHKHAEYTPGDIPVNIDIKDYLAVRLSLEHLFVRKYCRNLWMTEGNLGTIRGFFHRNYHQFFVRYQFFNNQLPEHLVGFTQQLLTNTYQQNAVSRVAAEWQQLALMIHNWQGRQAFQNQLKNDIQLEPELTNNHLYSDAWILFRLTQHLGLTGSQIAQLSKDDITQLLNWIALVDNQQAGYLLLQAYEHHYREPLFKTISQNMGRGTWPDRKKQIPEAQLFFCMDDREESIRRHLESINPNIETFGAAAFFGVVMKWKGLDTSQPVALCPVSEKPTHLVEEVITNNQQENNKKHKKYLNFVRFIHHQIFQTARINPLKTTALMMVLSPSLLASLVLKVINPFTGSQVTQRVKNKFDKKPVTRVTTAQQHQVTNRNGSDLTKGYSIDEQTDIVEEFLQNNGLIDNFSPLVGLVGHYSSNQNNPHEAAYGCGACGGKFSGPNGRVFATMANNPEVRTALKKRNIFIPDHCWFMGAEHDTCNDKIIWFDKDLIPDTAKPAFDKLRKELDLGGAYSAHERCRKFASAPKKASYQAAIQHVLGRSADISQSRPELGHATIASGFIGRRYITQGTFLDRRSFLISYDPKIDPDGKFLERVLLSVGPVGAGINLEYYFSAVNNDHFGSGSKIVHNLTGLLGVLDGASGDLRTGLPKQMIEIHEPMRLQLMIESTPEILTKIYQQQPTIQNLVGNGWILLSCVDPESAEIYTFEPDSGWVLWTTGNNENIPTVKDSLSWYSGKSDPIAPVLLKKVKPSQFEKADIELYQKRVSHV